MATPPIEWRILAPWDKTVHSSILGGVVTPSFLRRYVTSVAAPS